MRTKVSQERNEEPGASDEWTVDPPKKLVLLTSRTEVMSKAAALREVMESQGEEPKALPGLISASGANEAKVHLQAFVPVEQPDFETFEMARVELYDPRNATTERLSALREKPEGEAFEGPKGEVEEERAQTGRRSGNTGNKGVFWFGLGMLVIGCIALGIAAWQGIFGKKVLYLAPLSLPVPVLLPAPSAPPAPAESSAVSAKVIEAAPPSPPSSGALTASVPTRTVPRKKPPSEMVQ